MKSVKCSIINVKTNLSCDLKLFSSSKIDRPSDADWQKISGPLNLGSNNRTEGDWSYWGGSELKPDKLRFAGNYVKGKNWSASVIIVELDYKGNPPLKHSHSILEMKGTGKLITTDEKINWTINLGCNRTW